MWIEDRKCGRFNIDCRVAEYAGDYTFMILVIVLNEAF
jgi:hypothetical protein